VEKRVWSVGVRASRPVAHPSNNALLLLTVYRFLKNKNELAKECPLSVTTGENDV